MVARVAELISGLWGRPLLDDMLGGASFSPDGGASLFLFSVSGRCGDRGGCGASSSACGGAGHAGRGRGADIAVRADIVSPSSVSPLVRLSMESRDCAPGRDQGPENGVGGLGKSSISGSHIINIYAGTLSHRDF